MPTHGAGELLSTGFVLVAPCPGYPRPHPPRPNPRCSVRFSAVAGRLTPVHCIPGSFVPRLLCPPAPVGFVQWEVLAGDQRVGGERRWAISPLSPPSWVGRVAGTWLHGGSPPSCGSPRPRSRQPLAAPVPSPGPFGAGKVTASAIASPWEKIPRSPNSLQNPSGCVFHVLLGPDRRDTF